MSKKKLVVIILLVLISVSVFSVIKGHKLIFKDDWDFWVEKQVDFSIKQKLAKAKRHNIVVPDKDIDKIREKMRTELKADAAGLKEILVEPPPLMERGFRFEYEQNMPKKYEGPWPQTAQSVLEAFEGLENHRHDYDDELDAKYPRDKWVAMLLEKGAIFEHYGDYSRYMGARRGLMGRENNPKAWRSGKFGITPASDWESFKNNYIDREIWEVQQYNEAKKVDPYVSGGTFMGPNDSVFLPFNGNTVYIDQSGIGFKSFGVSLTTQEASDLMFNGVHPEGVEVIYIDDESGTFLDEKPSPFRWDTILEKAGPPPPGWEKNLPEGWSPPPGLVEAINNKFKNTDTATRTLDNEHTIPSETVLQNELLEDSPQDHLEFTQEERDFLEMLTKTEAEWEVDFDVELERFLTEEGLIVPSEADFENELHKKFEAEVLTPESLDKAMETLERDGLTEGFRQLQDEDPEVAKIIAELLSTRRPQRKSQRYTPLPKPPEAEED